MRFQLKIKPLKRFYLYGLWLKTLTIPPVNVDCPRSRFHSHVDMALLLMQLVQ